jgi:hypothetical protein
MANRYSKWFTIHPPVPSLGAADATYNGVYNGVIDPIGEGKPGQTYQVTILGPTKLFAPDDTFPTPEGFDPIK